ncbi:hypothetical protein, partial [Coleofasciculus sp.]|uniref:hypothetical protein n=1 Tax=Coleofasciculus sp. TaxID=3100458 RepID=UPI003A4122E6
PLFKGDGRGIKKGDGRGIDKGDFDLLTVIASIGSMLLGGHYIATVILLAVAFFFGSVFVLINVNSSVGR